MIKMNNFYRNFLGPLLLSHFIFFPQGHAMPEWFRQLKPDSLTLKKIASEKGLNKPLPKIENKNKDRPPFKCSHGKESDESQLADKELFETWYYQECIETGRHLEQVCVEAKSSITKFFEESKIKQNTFDFKQQQIASRPVPGCALDINNFAPAEHHPIKILNAVVFFPRRATQDPAGNFTTNHDGWGNTSYNANNLAQDTISFLNYSLANNRPMAWNGDLNPLAIPPVLPTQIQLRPTQPLAQEILLPYDSMVGPLGAVNGVSPFYFYENWSYPITNSYMSPNWFHFSFRNLSRTRPQFTPLPDLPGLMPGMARTPLQPVARPGVGFANRSIQSNLFWSETGDVQLNYIWHNGNPQQDLKVHLHELSHVLGNNHTFEHPWGLDEIWMPDNSGGFYRTFFQCSEVTRENDQTWCGKNNNIMDYNCQTSAWTPCQLKVAHFNLSHALLPRRYLPCKTDRQYNHELRGIPGTRYTWDGPHDIIGDLILYPGVTLTINCSVTLAENARIIKPQSSRIINEHLISRRKCQ
jgi:hypothetical protein